MNKLIKTALVMTFITPLVSCGQKEVTKYDVSFVAEHGSWEGENVAYANQEYSATFKPEEGYCVNFEELVVAVGKKRITSGYIFVENKLTIDASMITDNITVTSRAKTIEYSVDYDPLILLDKNKAFYKTKYDARIDVLSPFYLLPDQVYVYVDGKSIDSKLYTYVPNENKLTIEAEAVTGDIYISGKPVALVHVEFNAVNGYFHDGSRYYNKYIDKDQKFGQYSPSIPRPISIKDELEFDNWYVSEDEGSELVDPEKIFTEDAVVYAHYKDKHLTFSGNSSTYHFDWATILKDKSEIAYKSAFDLEIILEDKGAGSVYWMPESVKVTMENNQGIPFELQPGGDYTYKISDDGSRQNVKMNLHINEGVITGNIVFNINPSSVATVTFNPGKGTWPKGSTNPIVTQFRTSDGLNIVEAAILKAKLPGDPVSADPTMTFSGWYKTNTSEQVNVNDKVTGSLDLTASFSNRTFESDSWTNVINHANKGGANEIIKTYGYKQASDLIGLTRKVIVGNNELGYSEQKVTLLGIDHDDIANSNDKAVLTFGFNGILSDSIFQSASSPKTQYNQFTTSSLIEIYNNLTDYIQSKEIKDNLLTVTKKTYYNVGSEQNYYTTTHQLFPFSQVELDLTSPSGEDVKEEGTPYNYFEKYGKRDKLPAFSGLDEYTYWLRSPYINGNNDSAYYIDELGEVKYDSTDQVHGITAGFCIGHVKA